MTWTRGVERIKERLDNGELEQVEPRTRSRRLIDDADHHIASARAITETADLSGGYQLAYDALRNSAAALGDEN